MHKLYKFMPINENIYGSIGNSSLWFSDVRKFNDPFEGLFALKMPTNEEIKINELRQLSARYVEIVRQAGIKDAKDLPNHLSKNEYLAYLQPHFESVLKGIRNNLIERLGACCFVRDQTENQNYFASIPIEKSALQNQLMWSHYADGLRGLCIEFDGAKLFDGLTRLNTAYQITSVQIEYTDIRPTVNVWEAIKDYLHSDESGQILLIEKWLNNTSVKPSQWGYENELRFRALDAVNKNLTYPPEAINRIAFGQKMPEVHRHALKRLFISLGVSIEKFYEITIDDFNYALNLTKMMDI